MKDGIYKNLADGKEIQIQGGKVDLKVCSVIIEEL